MLILARREGEAVVIDGQIIVKVVSVRGNRVVLGFEASPEVVILRGELTEPGWLVLEQPTRVEPADKGFAQVPIEAQQPLVPANDQIAAIIQEEVQLAGGSIQRPEKVGGGVPSLQGLRKAPGADRPQSVRRELAQVN